MSNDINSNHLNQMARGAGFAILFNIIGFGLMFVFKLLAAKYFGPEQLGVYSLIETIFVMVILLASLQLYTGISRYVPFYKTKTDHSSLRGYLFFVKSLSLSLSIFFFFLLYFGSNIITFYFGFPADLSFFLKMIAILVPLTILDKYLRQIFVAEKKIFLRMFSEQVLEKFILLLGIVIIYFKNLDLFYLVLSFFISKVISLLFDYIIFKRKIFLPQSKKKSFHLKEWIYFSLPLLFSGVAVFLIGNFDNLMIGKMLGAQNLGVYSIVFSVASFLLFFQSSFAVIFMPLISENLAKKDNKMISFLFKKSSSWIFGLTLPLVLVLILYAKSFLKIFYGYSFSSGYLPLLILSIGMLVNVSTGLNTSILILHRKNNYQLFTNLFVVGINVVLNLLFIPIYGLIGAAIASAISVSLQQIILHLLARRYDSLKLDYIYYLKFISAGLPSLLISAQIFKLIPSRVIGFICSLIMYCLLYLFLLLLFKTFTKDDFKMFLLFEKKSGLNFSFLKKILNNFY